MRGLASLVLLGALTFAPSWAAACQFDTDCAVGSKCIKQGRLYGVCMGGMNPGNDHDKKPVYDPVSPGGEKAGDTCMFEIDCGPGWSCVKSGLYGVCMKR